VSSYLPAPGDVKTITLHVPLRDIPLLKGYRNNGLRYVESITGATIKNILPEESLAPGEIAYDAL
jgi:hypothetical protein